jgi:hypothetical protein
VDQQGGLMLNPFETAPDESLSERKESLIEINDRPKPTEACTQ